MWALNAMIHFVVAGAGSVAGYLLSIFFLASDAVVPSDNETYVLRILLPVHWRRTTTICCWFQHTHTWWMLDNIWSLTRTFLSSSNQSEHLQSMHVSSTSGEPRFNHMDKKTKWALSSLIIAKGRKAKHRMMNLVITSAALVIISIWVSIYM